MPTRRAFLKSAIALAAAGASLHPLAAWAMQERERSCLVVGSEKKACIVDLEKLTSKRVQLGYHAHSFLPHPDPARFVAVAKWEPFATEVNFEKGTARAIPIEHDHDFYGHGVYVPERKAIFFSRVDRKTGLGYLTGYDPETYKILHDFQVSPGGPHECHRMADNTYILVSAGFHLDYNQKKLSMQGSKRVAPSALVRVDLVGTGKVLSELVLDDPDHMLSHFRVTRTGQTLAIGGPMPWAEDKKGVMYYSADGVQPFRPVEIPADIENEIVAGIKYTRTNDPDWKEITKEMLSINLNGDHTRAAVTYPLAGKILLVDMTQGKVLKIQDQIATGVAPRGVSFDPVRKKFISSGTKLSFTDEAFTSQEQQFVAEHVPVGGPHSLILPSKISI